MDLFCDAGISLLSPYLVLGWLCSVKVAYPCYFPYFLSGWLWSVKLPCYLHIYFGITMLCEVTISLLSLHLVLKGCVL